MLAHENPFRMQRLEEELIFDPGWLGLSWADLLRRLHQEKWRGQIVGAHGTGKSACLRRLQTEFGHRIVLFNKDAHSPKSRRLDTIIHETTADDTLLIDGAEQLNFLQARRLFHGIAHARGVILTTHRRMRSWPVLLRCKSTPGMLHDITSRLAPEWTKVFTPGLCRHLFRRHHGNLREALWECYDRSAEGHPQGV